MIFFLFSDAKLYILLCYSAFRYIPSGTRPRGPLELAASVSQQAEEELLRSNSYRNDIPLPERASEPSVPLGGLTKRDGCTWARKPLCFSLSSYAFLASLLEEFSVFQCV